jgi:hypothetical protein
MAAGSLLSRRGLKRRGKEKSEYFRKIKEVVRWNRVGCATAM